MLYALITSQNVQRSTSIWVLSSTLRAIYKFILNNYIAVLLSFLYSPGLVRSALGEYTFRCQRECQMKLNMSSVHIPFLRWKKVAHISQYLECTKAGGFWKYRQLYFTMSSNHLIAKVKYVYFGSLLTNVGAYLESNNSLLLLHTPWRIIKVWLLIR